MIVIITYSVWFNHGKEAIYVHVAHQNQMMLIQGGGGGGGGVDGGCE